MGWLDSPDLVVKREAGGPAVAVVLLLPGQFFASHSIEEEGCDGYGDDDGDDDNDECMVGPGGKEEEERVRPLGAAAFRVRVLRARWGARRVVVMTPDRMHDLERRLLLAVAASELKE